MSSWDSSDTRTASAAFRHGDNSMMLYKKAQKNVHETYANKNSRPGELSKAINSLKDAKERVNNAYYAKQQKELRDYVKRTFGK